jgi:sulfur carrier protein
VNVRLRNPDREVDVPGGRLLQEILADLGVNPDTVLVIRDGELITRGTRVDEADRLEIRPVISGGALG